MESRERKMGKCWNKGSDEKRGGLRKRAGESLMTVQHFNSAGNTQTHTHICIISEMVFTSFHLVPLCNPLPVPLSICAVIHYLPVLLIFLESTSTLKGKVTAADTVGPGFVSCDSMISEENTNK